MPTPLLDVKENADVEDECRCWWACMSLILLFDLTETKDWESLHVESLRYLQSSMAVNCERFEKFC